MTRFFGSVAAREGWREGPDWLDVVTANPARAILVLLVLAFAAFLPGIADLPPVDRDEARFAQASKQMLESGDLVDIRFQDEARHKKPVGIYWMQAGVVAAAEAVGIPEARLRIGLYRVPSLAGAIAAVFLTFWAGLPLVGRRAAFLAAAMMAASVLLGVEARLAKTDAVLLAATLLAQGALARSVVAARDDRPLEVGTALLFWLGLGLAILVKGPIAPLVVGVTALWTGIAMRSPRFLRLLRPLPGLALLLAVVLPWFVLITLKTGGAFFEESVGKDLAAKVASGQESHGAPPGSYLALVWVTFWPGILFAALAVPFAWFRRRQLEVALLIGWLVPCWILFELVPTKLPHYVLPLYPALAMLLAGGLLAVLPGRPGRWTLLGGLFLITLCGVGLPLGAFGLNWSVEGFPPLAAVPFVLVALGLAAFAMHAFWQGRALATFVCVVGGAVATASAVYPSILSQMRAAWPAVALAEAVQGLGCPAEDVVTAGYREPSLVFLVGTGLRMADDGTAAADQLAARRDRGACNIALVERRLEPAFTARTGELGLNPALVTRIKGYNINGLKPLDIAVYRGTAP